jgi:hypothetical protein
MRTQAAHFRRQHKRQTVPPEVSGRDLKSSSKRRSQHIPRKIRYYCELVLTTPFMCTLMMRLTCAALVPGVTCTGKHTQPNVDARDWAKWQPLPTFSSPEKETQCTFIVRNNQASKDLRVHTSGQKMYGRGPLHQCQCSQPGTFCARKHNRWMGTKA